MVGTLPVGAVTARPLLLVSPLRPSPPRPSVEGVPVVVSGPHTQHSKQSAQQQPTADVLHRQQPVPQQQQQQQQQQHQQKTLQQQQTVPRHSHKQQQHTARNSKPWQELQDCHDWAALAAWLQQLQTDQQAPLQQQLDSKQALVVLSRAVSIASEAQKSRKTAQPDSKSSSAAAASVGRGQTSVVQPPADLQAVLLQLITHAAAGLPAGDVVAAAELLRSLWRLAGSSSSSISRGAAADQTPVVGDGAGASGQQVQQQQLPVLKTQQQVKELGQQVLCRMVPPPTNTGAAAAQGSISNANLLADLCQAVMQLQLVPHSSWSQWFVGASLTLMQVQQQQNHYQQDNNTRQQHIRQRQRQHTPRGKQQQQQQQRPSASPLSPWFMLSTLQLAAYLQQQQQQMSDFKGQQQDQQSMQAGSSDVGGAAVTLTPSRAWLRAWACAAARLPRSFKTNQLLTITYAWRQLHRQQQQQQLPHSFWARHLDAAAVPGLSAEELLLLLQQMPQQKQQQQQQQSDTEHVISYSWLEAAAAALPPAVEAIAANSSSSSRGSKAAGAEGATAVSVQLLLLQRATAAVRALVAAGWLGADASWCGSMWEAVLAQQQGSAPAAAAAAAADSPNSWVHLCGALEAAVTDEAAAAAAADSVSVPSQVPIWASALQGVLVAQQTAQAEQQADVQQQQQQQQQPLFGPAAAAGLLVALVSTRQHPQHTPATATALEANGAFTTPAAAAAAAQGAAAGSAASAATHGGGGSRSSRSSSSSSSVKCVPLVQLLLECMTGQLGQLQLRQLLRLGRALVSPSAMICTQVDVGASSRHGQQHQQQPVQHQPDQQQVYKGLDRTRCLVEFAPQLVEEFMQQVLHHAASADPDELDSALWVLKQMLLLVPGRTAAADKTLLDTDILLNKQSELWLPALTAVLERRVVVVTLQQHTDLLRIMSAARVQPDSRFMQAWDNSCVPAMQQALSAAAEAAEAAAAAAVVGSVAEAEAAAASAAFRSLGSSSCQLLVATYKAAWPQSDAWRTAAAQLVLGVVATACEAAQEELPDDQQQQQQRQQQQQQQHNQSVVQTAAQSVLVYAKATQLTQQRPHPAWLSQLEEQLPHLLQHGCMQSVATVLWAFGGVWRIPLSTPCLNSILGISQALLESTGGRACSSQLRVLLLSVALMRPQQLLPAPWLQSILLATGTAFIISSQQQQNQQQQQYQQQQQQQQPSFLASVAWSLARLGVTPSAKWQQLWRQQVSGQLARLSPDQLVDCLYAAAVWDSAAAAAAAAAHTGAGSPAALAQSSRPLHTGMQPGAPSSSSTLAADHVVTVSGSGSALQQHQQTRSSPGLIPRPSLPPAAARMHLGANNSATPTAAYAGGTTAASPATVTPRPWLEAVLQELRAKLCDCGPKQLTVTLWSLGQLNLRAPVDWLDALYDTLLLQLLSCSMQQLLQLLQGLLHQQHDLAPARIDAVLQACLEQLQGAAGLSTEAPAAAPAAATVSRARRLRSRASSGDRLPAAVDNAVAVGTAAAAAAAADRPEEVVELGNPMEPELVVWMLQLVVQLKHEPQQQWCAGVAAAVQQLLQRHLQRTSSMQQYACSSSEHSPVPGWSSKVLSELLEHMALLEFDLPSSWAATFRAVLGPLLPFCSGKQLAGLLSACARLRWYQAAIMTRPRRTLPAAAAAATQQDLVSQQQQQQQPGQAFLLLLLRRIKPHLSSLDPASLGSVGAAVSQLGLHMHPMTWVDPYMAAVRAIAGSKIPLAASEVADLQRSVQYLSWRRKRHSSMTTRRVGGSSGRAAGAGGKKGAVSRKGQHRQRRRLVSLRKWTATRKGRVDAPVAAA